MAGELSWGPGRIKAYSLRIVEDTDDDPDLSFLEDEGRYEGVSRQEAARYRKEDRERLDSYGSDWHMIGLWAEADFEVN